MQTDLYIHDSQSIENLEKERKLEINLFSVSYIRRDKKKYDLYSSLNLHMLSVLAKLKGDNKSAPTFYFLSFHFEICIPAA